MTAEDFYKLLLHRPIFIEFKVNAPMKSVGGIVYNVYETKIDIFCELVDLQKKRLYLVPLSLAAMIYMDGGVKSVKSKDKKIINPET